MKRILLDENIPIKLIELAPADCELDHVLRLGWAHMPDGELLDNAEAAGFETLLTADRSIAYQQNLQSKRISLVVVTTNNWPVIRSHAAAIFEAALAADIAVVKTVTLPHPVGSPRR